MAKARKKSPGDDRARQMAAVMNQFAARHNSVRENGLDDVEAGAAQVIEHAPEMSEADVADARELVIRCRALRGYEQAGNTLDARNAAIQIGRILGRIESHDAFAIARNHADRYVFDKGRPFKVPPQQQRILQFVTGKDTASMDEFVMAVWSEPFNVKKRGKYDKALTGINALMAKENVKLRLGTSGSRLVVSRF